jgi:hypothetical protein
LLRGGRTRCTSSGATPRSPRSARDAVMGLTPAALATSLRVMRPLERRLVSGLFKGLPLMMFLEVDLG